MHLWVEAGTYALAVLAAVILGGAVGGGALAAGAGVTALVVATYVALLRDQGRPSGASLADAQRTGAMPRAKPLSAAVS